MQKLSLLVLGLVAVCSASAATPAGAEKPDEKTKDKPLNVLFFGNSFTSTYELPKLVARFAVADGHPKPNFVVDCENGQDLAFHTKEVLKRPENNVNHPRIAGKTWDFVVIQGYSTEATRLRNPHFEKSVLTLYQAIEKHKSGRGKSVKAMLYETWARTSYVPSKYQTLHAMQAEITATYAKAAKLIDKTPGTSGPTRIATVGQAFEKAEGDPQIFDGYHPREKGAYLAALVIYRTLYNEDVSDMPLNSTNLKNKSDVEHIIKIANAVPIVAPKPTTRPDATTQPSAQTKPASETIPSLKIMK